MPISEEHFWFLSMTNWSSFAVPALQNAPFCHCLLNQALGDASTESNLSKLLKLKENATLGGLLLQDYSKLLVAIMHQTQGAEMRRDAQSIAEHDWGPSPSSTGLGKREASNLLRNELPKWLSLTEYSRQGI